MHVAVDRLARFFALVGRAVLAFLILLTCISIVGRLINTLLQSDFFQTILPALSETLIQTGIGPINGDYEVVEAGVAFAIFAFLPLCQLRGAHASVEVFTSFFSPRVNQVLRLAISIVFAAVLIVMAWKLFDGMQSKRSSGQLTFSLQFPIWWAYALSMSGAFVTALVAIYLAVMRLAEVMTGVDRLPPDLEANH